MSVAESASVGAAEAIKSRETPRVTVFDAVGFGDSVGPNDGLGYGTGLGFVVVGLDVGSGIGTRVGLVVGGAGLGGVVGFDVGLGDVLAQTNSPGSISVSVRLSVEKNS